MFDHFSDYMFSLLFTPLQKAKQAINQFFIFCKVIGSMFDETKEDIFRIREESMVISASEPLLYEHGRDRDMPRLKDELVENYRVRLCMKAIISARAGTLTALVLLLESLQLPQAYIRPLYLRDPKRWAEFEVVLPYHVNEPIIDVGILSDEVRKIKPASALDNYVFLLSSSVDVPISTESSLTVITGFKARPLDQIDDLYTCCLLICYRIQVDVKTYSSVITESNMWYLNGAYALDGIQQLNAERYITEL